MDNFNPQQPPVPVSPEYIPEPADMLYEAALVKLQELFPEARTETLRSIRGPFVGDILHKHNIPMFLDRFLKEDQEKKLKEGTGANSVEEAIKKILKDIPEDIIAFYAGKIGNPLLKVDPLDLV